MIVDIHLRFKGFHGSDGRCHVRFCKASHATPLVIICSQYKDYRGTSVTNAAKIIAEKVFYLVANNEIDDIRFDFELPVYDEWDHDVTLFDKLLVRLSPAKYWARFMTRKLQIDEIFSRIIWIEHYPEGWGSSGNERRYKRVELDKDGHPGWSALSDAWLTQHTGMSSAELLIDSNQLTLHRTDGQVRQAYQSSEVTLKRSSLQIVRWTEELVANLPAMLASHRARIGHAPHEDISESTVRDLITGMFASRLPSANFFKSDFNFSEALGITARGRPKNMDFAIFDPAGRELDAILELKRTSTKTPALGTGVAKDVARLLLLSRRFRCPCYLLVCGDIVFIREQLDRPDGMFSFDEHPSFMDRHFSVGAHGFDREYGELLDRFGILQGATRLQGMKANSHSSVLLWQVSADKHGLSSNRPYRYDIHAVS
jgi:hypothetical protein